MAVIEPYCTKIFFFNSGFKETTDVKDNILAIIIMLSASVDFNPSCRQSTECVSKASIMALLPFMVIDQMKSGIWGNTVASKPLKYKLNAENADNGIRQE